MRVFWWIDLSGKLYDKILVERTGFSFYVGIEYEKLPSFCKNVGHAIGECKKAKASHDSEAKKNDNRKSNKPNKPVVLVATPNHEGVVNNTLQVVPTEGNLINHEVHQIEGANNSPTKNDQNSEPTFNDVVQNIDGDDQAHNNDDDNDNDTHNNDEHHNSPIDHVDEEIIIETQEAIPFDILKDWSNLKSNWADTVKNENKQHKDNEDEEDDGFEPAISKSQKKKQRAKENNVLSLSPVGEE
ncbi:hypothetical protein P8452_09071 [Trifolium repens]|nr:hypothetical protein P8452_09071 [Trifolium repens]